MVTLSRVSEMSSSTSCGALSLSVENIADFAVPANGSDVEEKGQKSASNAGSHVIGVSDRGIVASDVTPP